MNEKIDVFSKEIEIMKKNQMENLKLINTKDIEIKNYWIGSIVGWR